MTCLPRVFLELRSGHTEVSQDGGMGVDNGRLTGDSGGGGRGERKTLGGKQKLVQFM